MKIKTIEKLLEECKKLCGDHCVSYIEYDDEDKNLLLFELKLGRAVYSVEKGRIFYVFEKRIETRTGGLLFKAGEEFSIHNEESTYEQLYELIKGLYACNQYETPDRFFVDTSSFGVNIGGAHAHVTTLL